MATRHRIPVQTHKGSTTISAHLITKGLSKKGRSKKKVKRLLKGIQSPEAFLLLSPEERKRAVNRMRAAAYPTSLRMS